MMGSSLFYACKNIHEPILIAKESMHFAVHLGSACALRTGGWSYVNHPKTHPNKDETEVEFLKEKGISAHTNYRKDSRQCFTIQACISIVINTFNLFGQTSPDQHVGQTVGQVLVLTNMYFQLLTLVYRLFCLTLDDFILNSEKYFGISRIGYCLCKYGKLGCWKFSPSPKVPGPELGA